MPAETTVEIADLSYAYGDGDNRRRVLAGIDLTLRSGEVVVLSGPSGSGKTTMLSLIGGLRTPQAGTLRVLGRSLASTHGRDLLHHRRQIGFIFQHHNLFPALTAYESVRLATDLDGARGTTPHRAAVDILTRLGLESRMAQKPEKLSGGERQRVAIARALVRKPRIVLADEPTAALDTQNGIAVLDLFTQLARGSGSTVLMVSHDTRLYARADRVVRLVDGRIASDFRVEEVIDICETLKRSGLFDAYTPFELTELAQRMSVRRYGPGEPIVRGADEGDGFYLIRSGAADVVDPATGNVVATIGRGEFFVERAPAAGVPQDLVFRARDALEVYGLDRVALATHTSPPSLQDELRRVMFQGYALWKS